MNSGKEQNSIIILAGLTAIIILVAFILPRFIVSDRSEPALTEAKPTPVTAPEVVKDAVTAPEAAPRGSEGKEIASEPEPTPRQVGDIAGRVSDASGGPIPGCEVTAVSHGGNSLKGFRRRGRYRVSESFAITDASGEFIIANLAPGDYTVAFRAPEYAYAEYASSVRVSADQVTGGINQTLELAGIIFGEVVENVSARPIAGATVSAEVVSAKTHPREILSAQQKLSVLTDAGGKFRLDMLLPSEFYDLYAGHPLYISETIASVPVDSGSPVRLALWPSGSIGGVVTRNTDDAPVPGAKITVSAGKRSKREVTSATDGEFLIQGLEAGAYQLAAEKDGFYTRNLTEYTVPVGRAGKHSVDLILVPGGAVELTVIDKETHRPVPGATVAFDGRKLRVKLTTDDEGKVRLTGLREGSLSFTATADGYASTDPYSGNAWFDVKLEKTITRTFELEPERFFYGRVVDEEDQPVPGARVKVEMKWEGRMGSSVHSDPVLSDATGSFRIGKLQTGSYEYSVQKDSYAPLRDHVQIPQKEEAKVVLYRGATLEGTVSDRDGKPLEGFEVRLWSLYAGSTTAKVTSNQDGAWEMTQVPAGSYTVTAQKEKQRTEVKEFELGWKDHKTIDLRLQEGITVAGKVVDGKDGHGLEEIELKLITTDEMGYVRDFSGDQYKRDMKTDSAGGFLLNGVPPGNYEVQVQKYPDRYLPPLQEQRTLIKVEDADITDLIVELKRAASVRGKALLPSGEPAVGANLAVDHADFSIAARHQGKKTDAKGEFHLVGLYPAKDCRLCAKLGGFGAAISEPFSLRQGDVIEDMVLRLQTPGSLSGSIKDHSGNPLSKGYSVRSCFPHNSADHSDAARLAHVSPDESGRYEMQNLPPGELRIQLWGEVPCFDGGSGCRSILQSKSAHVSSGQETTGVDFIVSSEEDKSGHISGRVVTSGGQGISGITVKASMLMPDRSGGGQAVTQDDGTFLIENIPQGMLSLHASGQGYVPKQIYGVESPSDNVSIILGKAAGVEGCVIVGETGRPVQDFVVSHGPSGGRLRDQTFADSEGTFRLENLEPGLYLLRARAKEMGIAEKQITLRVEEIEYVVLELRPPCQVAGRVIRKTDKSAVRGAIVEPGTDRKAVTGYDGRFIASGFPFGEATITIEHRDFGTQRFPGVRPAETGTGREVLFELSDPGRIEGHVYDRFGEPWESAQITLDDSWQTRQFTNYEGFYKYPRVSPGTHTVIWNVDTRGTGGTWKQTIEVESGRTTTVDFGGVETVVSGTVIMNGIPKYLEVVTFSSAHTIRWVQADRDGRFEIFGLPPGIYTVTVKPPGGDTSWTERTVEVPAGEEIFLEFEKS